MHRYCARCGQNDRNYIRATGPVAWEFFRESFEVDSRIFQTLRLLLFKPGSLSDQFSLNRRAKYMSPVRLYLFTSFLFFLVLSLSAPDVMREQESALEVVPSADVASALPTDTVLHGAIRISSAFGAEDTTALPSDTILAGLRAALEPGQRQKLDDILGRREGATSREVAIAIAHVMSRANPRDVNPAQPVLDGSERMAEVGRPGFLVRRSLNSTIDLLHDPGMFTQRLIGNMPIAMFFLLPFYALALKACYVTKKRFFVEHLVFAMHIQAFGFVAFAAALLTPAGPVGSWVRLSLVLIPQLYYLIALRRYYRDGWFRTLFKGFIVWWLYLVVLLPGFLIVLFLTA